MIKLNSSVSCLCVCVCDWDVVLWSSTETKQRGRSVNNIKHYFKKDLIQSSWQKNVQKMLTDTMFQRSPKNLAAIVRTSDLHIHLCKIQHCPVWFRGRPYRTVYSSKPANEWLLTIQKFIIRLHWLKDEWTYYALKRHVKSLARRDSSLISSLPDKRQRGGDMGQQWQKGGGGGGEGVWWRGRGKRRVGGGEIQGGRVGVGEVAAVRL